ncbi:hypothetical protein [Symmachiella dynata]|uniref:hypothetical protein n=1 Tax=Symmachiella dynata TaxID=2527995 RepID=UPI0018D2BC35|nr:hypothetical protein [Symmachiella dynata]
MATRDELLKEMFVLRAIQFGWKTCDASLAHELHRLDVENQHGILRDALKL